jgi:hypothetical protein
MPRNLLLSLAASVVLLAALPAGASAATCEDYSNQADAQRAQDTRDADGDGIYCESLPCPCLKPGDTGGGGSTPTPAPAPKPEQVRCGTERWTVKTLQDTSASQLTFDPHPTTVRDLRNIFPPHVGRGTPRQPGEFTTYRINVRLRSFKIENDSDIHLVVADPRNSRETMIVELPNAGCTKNAGSAAQRRMSGARRALLRACGSPSSSSFGLVSGTAALTGIGFFDVIHGQRGVAPNGIELHPLLSFKATSRCRAR